MSGLRGLAARLEPALVALVALHSIAIGAGALAVPAWGARFGGFAGAEPLFFVRQVGVFHVVVAVAYLIEWVRHRSVVILLTTKTIAVVFLGTMMAVDTLPWVVPFSAAGDALMGVGVAVVHGLARGARRA